MNYDNDEDQPIGTSANDLSERVDERIFNGKDLYAIDKKIDDGSPATGDLLAFRVGCSNSAYTAYDLSNPIDQCYAMYKLKDLRP